MLVQRIEFASLGVGLGPTYRYQKWKVTPEYLNKGKAVLQQTRLSLRGFVDASRAALLLRRIVNYGKTQKLAAA